MSRGWASSSRPAGCRSPTRWLKAGGDGPTGRGAETGSTRSRKCSRSCRPLPRSTDLARVVEQWPGRMWSSASRARRVGADALDEHRTGNEVGLAAIRQMAGSAVPRTRRHSRMGHCHEGAGRCRPARMPPIVVPNCATEAAETPAIGDALGREALRDSLVCCGV